MKLVPLFCAVALSQQLQLAYELFVGDTYDGTVDRLFREVTYADRGYALESLQQSLDEPEEEEMAFVVQGNDEPVKQTMTSQLSPQLNIQTQQQLQSGLRMPDITDRNTILTLGMMCSNAYTTPSMDNWRPLDDWVVNKTIGWSSYKKPPREGLKAHVFVGKNDSSQVIIVYKGTTPLGNNWDRRNDNFFFSCCCGRVDPVRVPACDCFSGRSWSLDAFFRPKCDLQCYKKATQNYSRAYYPDALELYNMTKAKFPDADITFLGHSLGGALASLLSLTTGRPAITFQTPGDKTVVERMDLMPDDKMVAQIREDGKYNFAYDVPIYHFGNDADYIFLGLCNGLTSVCFYGGYAMETKCHIGHKCIYELNRSTNVNYHKMAYVIKEVLMNADSVPECKLAHYVTDKVPDNAKQVDYLKQQDTGCQDCPRWLYV